MYDLATAAEIIGAPPLEGLDVERLPQKLTEAYARVVSARISMLENRDETGLKETLDELKRLGYTYLSLVNFSPTPEIQKSAAFVAGSAFALLAMRNGAIDEDFTTTSICLTYSTVLLFLIADATSDAMEVIKRLPFDEHDNGLQNDLKKAIRCLVSGNLVSMVESIQSDYSIEIRSVALRAVYVLYGRCLEGIKELCRALLGGGNIESAFTIFEQTKNLCIDDNSDLINDPLLVDKQCLSTFPGPFWLACLLEIVSQHLFQHALINIQCPTNINVNEWKNEIIRLAHFRPYLWPNHKKIIEEYKYLEFGVSAVLGLPTGAGKTTLSQIKASTHLLNGHKILYLAPTHALVRQVTNDWRKIFPNKNIQNSFLFDWEYAETENSKLPHITVMTPERCLSLLTISPEAFSEVGLIIMDECHILHAVSLEASYRATDSMYCLHRLFDSAKNADFLFMSAMIENTDDLAAWIEQQTGKTCVSVKDEWKPTRQVRSCVIYPHSETRILNQKLKLDRNEARKIGRKLPGAAVKRELEVHPYGFFCLNQTWNTTKLRDYVVLPLSNDSVLLGANSYWGLTSNRNEVSSALAVKLADANIKTIVFSQQVKHTQAIAQRVADEIQSQNSLVFNEREQELWERLTEEFGSTDHIFGPLNGIVACHHGLLLADERELIEGLFTRKDGIKTLVATPTLAQGMNLPAEAVIIAGDERFDTAENEQSQLEAHELLNAAGRAGRAGQHAQGFVFIVPGGVVDFDEEHNTLGSRWFALQKNVFSKSDQCLVIVDPLQRLIDAVHAGISKDDRPVQYILRRMPYNPDLTPEKNVQNTMLRSFAAFMAQRRSKQREFDLYVNETMKFGREIIQPVDIEEHQWVTPLATELGIKAEVLLEINSLLDNISVDWNAIDYIKWSFENRMMDKMLKPQTINDIVTNLTTPAERKTRANINEIGLNRLKLLLLHWIAGYQFNQIENLSGMSNNGLGKCDIARKLALRWSADVAYALGVITRLYRHKCDIQKEIQMPIALATLAACVRQGVDLPSKLAIFHLLHYDINRVQVHRMFENIRSKLIDGELFESFFQTLKRVNIAIKKTYNI